MLTVDLGDSAMKKCLLISSLILTSIFSSLSLAGTIKADPVPVDNSGGWANVPLTDQSNFEINCEYRVYRDDPPYGAVHQDILYPSVVKPGYMYFAIMNESATNFYRMDSTNKGYIYHETNTSWKSALPTVLQKRCKINQAPADMVALFMSSQCPTGWKEWPGKFNVSCADSTECANFVFCKKQSDAIK